MDILKSKTIAVCITDASEETVVEHLLLLHDAAMEHGCKLVIFSSVSNLMADVINYECDCFLFKNINFRHFDAVISFSENIKDASVLESISKGAAEAGIPVFSIDRYVEGCINIRMDYASSFEKLVRHVVEEHKLTKVNFISGMPDNEFSEERELIYKKVLADNNIPFEEKRMGYGYFWEEPAELVVEKFLEDDELPEAIICANDVMALVACKMLKEKGVRVPEDVIVTGFDGIIRGQWNSPSLTTCKIDFTMVISTIMSVLADVLSGREYKNMYEIPYEFSRGESCGCVKKNHHISAEALFDIYDFNKAHSFYQKDMYEMQTRLSETESMFQFALVTHSFMFTEGSIVIHNSIPEFEDDNNKDAEINLLPNAMRVLVRKKNNNEIEMGQLFELDEVLPELMVQTTVERPIMILPLHCMGHNFGYMAFSVNHEPIFFSKMVMINYAIGNSLEIFRVQKSLLEVNRRVEEANARMAELYIRDSLTMLFNRRGFYSNVNSLMDKCIKKGWGVFVASIDLDDLKPINDLYGHAEGDNAIKTIASSLIANAHEHEICARFGGDEFVVAGIAEDASTIGNQYVKNVEEYLENYNRNSEKPYKIIASIGLSVNKPDEKSLIDEFIIQADHMMYEKKKTNKQFRSKVRTSSNNLFPNR